MSLDGKQIFVMGHPEYDRVTLNNEYMRDKNKGLEISLPKNYYPDDNFEKQTAFDMALTCEITYIQIG